MADYTPTLFQKGSKVRSAQSWQTHWQLIFDGYLPIGAAPVPTPQNFPERLEVLEETVGDVSLARRLPSYVGARRNPYDPRLNVYNFKPSNTRRLRTGLSRAMGGGIGQAVVIGDSGPAGATSMSTWDRPRSWPAQALAELTRHGIPKGGTGLVRVTDGGLSADTRLSTTGTWNATGRWYAFSAANGATLTFTSDFAGDRVSILYYDLADNATFTVSINGVSQGTVTASGPAGLKVLNYSAAIAAGQTIVFTKTSVGGMMDLVGVQVWSNANGGMIFHNIAQSGSLAAGTGANSWSDASTTTALGSLISTGSRISHNGTTQPDVVIIGLGGNDLQGPFTNSQVATALTTIRNRFPQSDAILVAQTQLNDTLVTAAKWESFISSLYDLADTLDIPLVDQRARLGNYADVVARGLSTDGAGHLIAGANAGLGRNLGQILAA